MTLEEIGMEALEGQVILLGLRKDCSHRTGGKRWSRYLPHAPPGPDTGMTWMGNFGKVNAGPMEGQ